MPVPKFNLSPPFDILRISHTKFYVKDLEKSRRFYEDILGLQITTKTGNHKTGMRMFLYTIDVLYGGTSHLHAL